MADYTGTIDARFPELTTLKDGWYSITMGVPGTEEGGMIVPEYPYLGGDWIWNRQHSPYLADYDGLFGAELGDFWFGIIHVFPRRIDVGIVLTQREFQIEIYNAYKFVSRDWETYANNTDSGIGVAVIPSLTHVIEPLSGYIMTMTVTPYGPPTITGTIDFGFDVYGIPVYVSGIRVVMFTYRPEEPLGEELEFLTEILTAIDGSEQRIACRKNPRQIFDMSLFKHTQQRQAIETLIYEWQAREFGVPVWCDRMTLQTDALVGNLTVTTSITDYTDLRVGGLAIVRESHTKYDALEVYSFTSTSITFASGLTHDYSPGVEIFPVRRCYAESIIRGSRFAADLERYSFRFRVIDNDNDLADASAFPTKSGKPFLTNPNLMDRTLGESYEIETRNLDEEIGIFTQTSLWERNKRISTITLLVLTAQELWEARQLLHYLKGQQKSFYLPTSYYDLLPIATLINGGATMNIPYIGFTKFAVNKVNKQDVRIHLTDGTILSRTVDGSVELSEDVEQLSVDSAWPYEILPDQVSRIEFIELVRIVDDSISIVHENGYQTARIEMKVKGVFDNDL